VPGLEHAAPEYLQIRRFVVERREDHPRLRRSLKDRLLSPREVATEIAPHVRLPCADGDGDSTAAVEAHGSERA
jgi:hypothetical protein